MHVIVSDLRHLLESILKSTFLFFCFEERNQRLLWTSNPESRIYTPKSELNCVTRKRNPKKKTFQILQSKLDEIKTAA